MWGKLVQWFRRRQSDSTIEALRNAQRRIYTSVLQGIHESRENGHTEYYWFFSGLDPFGPIVQDVLTQLTFGTDFEATYLGNPDGNVVGVRIWWHND